MTSIDNVWKQIECSKEIPDFAHFAHARIPSIAVIYIILPVH